MVSTFFPRNVFKSTVLTPWGLDATERLGPGKDRARVTWIISYSDPRMLRWLSTKEPRARMNATPTA
ncbi:hypothetical protein WG66_001126 [Moniliophthora roreri]|nr:hypothetical protein WG66_001126 [Moniliophthora roreri]